MVEGFSVSRNVEAFGWQVVGGRQMSRVEPRVLKGFRDYLPEVMAPRERMLRKVQDVFEQYGYQPLATPALEYTEILMGKYGVEGDKLLYRFEDNGGRDVSLRYDLTVPLARVVAQHTTLSKPFRRYQIAPVWRAEKPARGRFREFVQCDVDVVGSDSLMADFECIQVGVDVLRALGVDEFQIRLNDRRILDGLLLKVGIADRSGQLAVLRAVDKLPKIGWDGVRKELETIEGMTAGGIEALHGFLHGTLDTLSDDTVDMATAGAGIESLNQLLAWAQGVGIEKWVAVDLSIARGLDYYTGTIYETFLGAIPELGSVMSGGRYDDLLTLFTKDPVPAVGISLGVDRLLAGLLELGVVDSGAAHALVYITVFDDACLAYSQEVAREMRSEGLNTCIHLTPGQKLGKQFKSASRSNAAFVVVAGPDERDAGRVTVKNMDSGEQHVDTVQGAVAWLQAQINAG